MHPQGSVDIRVASPLSKGQQVSSSRSVQEGSRGISLWPQEEILAFYSTKTGVIRA